jgi:aspartyl-tRNA(Asn)/glutamyl-tRNA(Gln) amidotransferase subunit B
VFKLPNQLENWLPVYRRMSASIHEKYIVVIGLEVHAQLLTSSKIYSTDSTSFGSPPNTNVSVVTLAHPGTLPLLNKKVVAYAIKMGLACHSDISRFNIFDRKNYFYPDLPKGYQLTQDRTPICKRGYITIQWKEGDEKKQKDVKLNRIHVEEDAGKSIHLTNESDTLIDLNRAGVPLIEIVTEPDLRSSEEASALLTEIRKMVRYLEICDGNMEEGSMRCDANVSIMLRDAKEYGKKVEIKNMNSIRNVKFAIDHEVERQISEIENGNKIVSETRLFDVNTGKTFGMRTKEELNDYRYFPDPDLSPLVVSEEWLNELKASMPSMPWELTQKYMNEYQLPEYDAKVITDSKEMAMYFEDVCKHASNFKAVANWIMGPVKSYLNDHNITAAEFPIPSKGLAELIILVEEGKISFSVASQKVFPVLLQQPNAPAGELAQLLNVLQDSNHDSIMPIIEEVIKEFPLKVEEYRKGKKGIISMFMGEVMKRSKGKADPKMANTLLTKKLAEV